jgi:regulator of replication initiation timing
MQLAAAAHETAQLQERLTALRADHSQLLTRLSEVTRKWQGTVAQNQQLHMQNGSLQTQLGEAQQQLALLQHECQQYRQLMQLQ